MVDILSALASTRGDGTDPLEHPLRRTDMDLDTRRPFRGSDAIRDGHLTAGVLAGRRFRRLDHDTYVDSAVPDSPLLDVRAALVRAGPDALATGWSACTALGVDVAPRTMPVELATPGRRSWPGPGVTARRTRFADDEVTAVDGTPTTTLLRTAFDLATRSGTDRSRPDPVVDPLTDAVAAADALARRGGFGADELGALAVRHRGSRGVRRVARVAALLDRRADSPPESRLRVKLVLAGLPRPVVRHELCDEAGWLRRELDLAWPDQLVAVEYDGRDHARADRRGHDIDRLDALSREGWLVIVVTAPQAGRPRWVPDRVREALLSRGWVPGPHPWAAVVAENAAARGAR